MIYGGHGIGVKVIAWILRNIKDGDTVVELGAGDVSTDILRQFYRLFTVESQIQYCDKYSNVEYIYAPIVGDWYDTKILNKTLPLNSSLILIDGPHGDRRGFLKNIHLFDTTARIVFHDTEREREALLVKDVAKALNKEASFVDDNDGGFAYI